MGFKLATFEGPSQRVYHCEKLSLPTPTMRRIAMVLALDNSAIVSLERTISKLASKLKTFKQLCLHHHRLVAKKLRFRFLCKKN